MRILRITRAGIAWLLLASGPSAVATPWSADICYGPANTPAAQPTTNATVFVCPKSGKRTIPQLANSGWKVVRLSPIFANGAISERLVLRSADALFRADLE